jgi:AcrR family transcriptional regulator
MSFAHLFYSPFAQVPDDGPAMPTKLRSTAVSHSAPSRRIPSQARSEQTIRIIFEATAQVLSDHGETALTTNRIAQRAGVSVGTLYQYFDSKEAIVLAMLAREREQCMGTLDLLLANADPASAEPVKSDPRMLLRAFIRRYVEAFGTGAPGRRALIRLAWRLDSQQILVQSLREASDRIALHIGRMQHPLLRAPSPAMAFVLTRLLAGTVRSASLEDSPLLGTTEFEDALVNACWGVMHAADSWP